MATERAAEREKVKSESLEQRQARRNAPRRRVTNVY
jgi:hypothetical protein